MGVGEGGSMLKSQILQEHVAGSTENSGVLIPQPYKRAWDWRASLRADCEAEDLLRILRLGLAKEFGRALVEGIME